MTEELKQETEDYVKQKYFNSDFSFGFSLKDFVEAILHFAEPREKRIAELEAQIERMKNCMNCVYYRPISSKTKWNPLCKSVKDQNHKCCKLYKFEGEQ